MGCCGSIRDDKLVWDPHHVLSSGADKEICAGTYDGQPACVCVVCSNRSQDRLKREIEVLQILGAHPYIIKIYHNNPEAHRPYFVLERVDPIGYDMRMMRNHYAFMELLVPSSLMAHLMDQVAVFHC
jgi:serine/threonine protein kinase